jgi:hypothetical protein
MKKYFFLVCLITFNLSAFAQAEFDALRLSQTDITGTARYVGMSGAFGALGGDMSAIAVNPAGIGIYRSSEISITPSFQGNFVGSDLNGSISETENLKVLMNSFGYVGSFRTYDESAISNFNFAVTYNRTADFNRNTNVVGIGRTTSLLDRICDVENTMWNTDGTHPNHTNFFDYVDGVGVIGLNTEGDSYEPFLNPGELTNNSMQLTETGGIDSWNFTLGANYNHSLYLGIGVGIQSIDYERNSSYVEEYAAGGGTELRNTLTTTGSGVDFKAGLIFRPVPELRLGVSYKTGTYYTLTDVFKASMASWGFIAPASDVYTYVGATEYVDYMLKTPWQWTISAAYQFEDKGLFSIDFDYLDNRSILLKNSSGFEMTDINEYMDYDFRKSYHIRAGGEIRMTDNISLRMGAAWYSSPLIKNLEGYDIATAYTRPEYSMPKDTWYASMGLGYRSGAFFTDVAVQEKLSTEHFFNYCDMSTSTEYAVVTSNKVNLVLTAGFKF